MGFLFLALINMPSTSARAIPLVNLKEYVEGDSASKEAFSEKLASAFHTIGFVGVTQHGIPKELITDFYKAAKVFFALPTEEKRRYEYPGAAGQRGYTSFGKEHAKQSKVADLKEFFQIGQETKDMSDDERNPHVEEVPEFMELGKKLYRAFEQCGLTLLEAIALHLNLPQDYFRKINTDGISILRAIHYPPYLGGTRKRNPRRTTRGYQLYHSSCWSQCWWSAVEEPGWKLARNHSRKRRNCD